MVSQHDLALDSNDLSAVDAYIESVVNILIQYMLSDDLHGDVSSVQCIRAFGFDQSKNVEVVLDSGADGSVLLLAYSSVGFPDKDFDGSSYIDAQEKPISVCGARIAKVRFGPVVFRERFIIAAVTSRLIIQWEGY